MLGRKETKVEQGGGPPVGREGAPPAVTGKGHASIALSLMLMFTQAVVK